MFKVEQRFTVRQLLVYTNIYQSTMYQYDIHIQLGEIQNPYKIFKRTNGSVVKNIEHSGFIKNFLNKLLGNENANVVNHVLI